MKILSASQLKKADQYTIQHEPISSIDLMERAASQLSEALLNYHSATSFHIFCGMGNNGGDGLAIARLLHYQKASVFVYVVKHSETGSEDFNTNLKRLEELPVIINYISEESPEHNINEGVLVDALLGSGLNRPLEGLLQTTVNWLNQLALRKVAIDIPTGLFADNNVENNLKYVFNADLTLSLQFPKRSFFNRETAPLTGKLNILDIGLHSDFLKEAETEDYYFDQNEALLLYRSRVQHSYKNTYGHALLLAGSEGKYGAAILAARAVMRSGAGLLTVHASGSGMVPLQNSVPEAMVSVDPHQKWISSLPQLNGVKAVGMGPGIGKEAETIQVLKNLIQNSGLPQVLDADALNILAENPTWLAFLPKDTILTPHIGEFKRLLGKKQLNQNYLEELRQLALKNGLTIVLKDSTTAIASPNGTLHFINSGSPALATAGSGDVLTGIILGLLSQGYPAFQAALLGSWIHGTAGNIAGIKLSLESVVASDVIEEIPSVFKVLAQQKE